MSGVGKIRILYRRRKIEFSSSVSSSWISGGKSIYYNCNFTCWWNLRLWANREKTVWWSKMHITVWRSMLSSLVCPFALPSVFPSMRSNSIRSTSANFLNTLIHTGLLSMFDQLNLGRKTFLSWLIMQISPLLLLDTWLKMNPFFSGEGSSTHCEIFMPESTYISCFIKRLVALKKDIS